MRELSIRQLKLFLKLCETGSLTETAALHGVTQPALSRSIKDMELNLGYQLFNRNARGVSLTSFGQRVLPIAKHIVAEYDFGFSTISEFMDDKPERLLVASITSMVPTVVAPALARLRASRPNIELNVCGGMACDIVEAVFSGRAEVGFSTKPTQDSRLIYSPVTSDSLLLVCRNDDPLCSGESVPWEMLEGQSLLTLGTRSILNTLVSDELKAAKVSIASIIECQEFSQIGVFLNQRMGVAIVPSSAISLLGSEFAAVPLRPDVTRQLGIITRSDRPLTDAASDLIAIVRSQWTN